MTGLVFVLSADEEEPEGQEGYEEDSGQDVAEALGVGYELLQGFHGYSALQS